MGQGGGVYIGGIRHVGDEEIGIAWRVEKVNRVSRFVVSKPFLDLAKVVLCCGCSFESAVRFEGFLELQDSLTSATFDNTDFEGANAWRRGCFVERSDKGRGD